MSEPAAPDMAARADLKAQTTHGLSHITALDGLRGIAVLLVLLFHFSWSFPDRGALHWVKEYMWSGWIGVDMFFVLSGYLITRGLVKDSPFTVGKRLKLFWARRAFRIFPLYYIVVIAGTLVCLALAAREEIPGASYWLYFQNYTLAFDPKPLRWTAHFWSLAIEEQFYFVWPLVVLLSGKRRRLQVATLLLVLSALTRTAFMILGHKVHVFGWDDTQLAKFVYRATPMHMDGLLIGAILAMFDQDPSLKAGQLFRRIRVPLFFGSLAFMLLLMVWTKGFGTYDRRVLILGYPTLAVMFGCMVSLAAAGWFPASLQRAFSKGPLPACGKVSYGMYIFHWMLVIFLAPWQEAQNETLGSGAAVGLGVAVIVLGMLAVYGIATLSYRFLESPFLQIKSRFHD